MILYLYSIAMKRDLDLVKLGKRIRYLRKARGFSQEYFANLIHINRGYYGAIERGEANFSAYNLFKIANGLRVTLNDLVTAETQAEENGHNTDEAVL